MSKTVYFFSNHTETEALENILGRPVVVIEHPYIEPEWDMEQLAEKCADKINFAVAVPELIINGDYSLVSLIVHMRKMLGKRTGFICMKKISGEAVKDKDGNITHRNVLKPINIRWFE